MGIALNVGVANMSFLQGKGDTKSLDQVVSLADDRVEVANDSACRLRVRLVRNMGKLLGRRGSRSRRM
ncbi:hypothetical protein AB7008_21405 [Bradyrhizobium sp. 521_C7_N1_3]|uniref:hypothetical protein n=1 Tax=Bradyrhizobium sp. 521_C7_N1_3 TaxID=3240368 RepID=UPI003F8A8FC2